MENKRNLAKGTLRRPGLNKKKIIIIAAVLVFICLSASGVIYMFKGGSKEAEDDFGMPRIRHWTDTNMPNPQKQTAQEIMAYMDSDQFKNLSDREKFMYGREGGRKVMDYQMDTYSSLTDDKQKTALLDGIIDRMEAQRAEFEQMRDARPRRDPNDPNFPRPPRNRFNPANMRARSERGTAAQRAQRMAFFSALQSRMQARGITMPGPGGGRGFGGGGFGGGPRSGR